MNRMEKLIMNNDSSIKNKVVHLLMQQFQLSETEVNDDLSFGDIPQWDSLGHMSLISALEDEFHLEVDADLIAQLTSVKAIYDHIESASNE
jgi:acyl carrier protein